MTVDNQKFIISSLGSNSLIDITDKIKGIAQNCEAKCAVVNIYVKNLSSSIITIDCKKGLSEDFLNYIKNLIPINWKQDNVSNDDSVFAYSRAAILGRNITFAITDKKLELLENQRIVVVDFGVIPSEIEIVVSIIT